MTLRDMLEIARRTQKRNFNQEWEYEKLCAWGTAHGQETMISCPWAVVLYGKVYLARKVHKSFMREI